MHQPPHTYNGRHSLKTLALLVTMVIGATGCYYDKGELIYPGSAVDCSKVTATYTAVKPIIAGKCNTAGCHNAGSAAGATVLETYDQVKALAGRIKQRAIIDKTMPPGNPLTSADIAVLTCWINSGTPNN